MSDSVPARRRRRVVAACIASALALGLAASAAAQVAPSYLLVPDPGNAADDTGFGAVPYWYVIGENEVTHADYARFLNAVAADDPNRLYNPNMDHSLGIQRSGAPGSYSYSAESGSLGRIPVFYVSFADALRYANWLHNGEPSGAQGPTTTEDGAYTISASGLEQHTIVRNPGARFFVPSEDEWVKSAYYDPESDGWFDYPVASDTETVCTNQPTLPNAGNCDDVFTSGFPVGSYLNSPSPIGSFDQGGNAFEWTEGVIGGSTRVIRGGSWFSDPADQHAAFRASSDPEVEAGNIGFRVAPEPGALVGALAGLGMLGALQRRRHRGAVRHPLLALVLSLAFVSFEPAAAATCSEQLVPAALADGQPLDQTIHTRLCHPGVSAAPEIADTVIVFVHGITYDKRYWDIPDPSSATDRYSFVSAALSRGFSTLAIDRIGSGQSSHPLSADVNIDSNARTVHDVIQAVRSGALSKPGGGSFGTVILTGHSYGSWTSWFEATRYDDIDAVVLTGATHGLTEVDAPFNVVSSIYPAVFDPQYMDSGLDPGYQTTQPGTRYFAFYAPGPVDPEIIAADEASKGTVTNAEIQTYQLILDEPLDIRVPVFLLMGSNDTLFCGPAPGGADCSSEEALIAFESPHLGPNVPSVDAYILPGGGHDLNAMFNAPLAFDATLDWVEGLLLP